MGSENTRSRSSKHNSSLLSGSCTCFFPQLRNEKLLFYIFQYLLPHELSVIQYLNTYIYGFLSDELKWHKIVLCHMQRMHKFNEKRMTFSLWYPGFKSSYVEISIRKTQGIKRIPNLFKSVESLQHRFFLIGGEVERKGRMVCVADNYEFRERNHKLYQATRMTHPRKSIHSAVFEEHIYALSGTDKGKHLTCCEKYLIDKDYWVSIPSLKRPIINGGVCVFKGQSIYHFEPDRDKGQTVAIERYSMGENTWTLFPINIYPNQGIKYINFIIPTHTQILIFGNLHYILFDPPSHLTQYQSTSFLTNEKILPQSICKRGNQVLILTDFHLYDCNLFLEKIDIYSDINTAILNELGSSATSET